MLEGLDVRHGLSWPLIIVDWKYWCVRYARIRNVQMLSRAHCLSKECKIELIRRFGWSFTTCSIYVERGTRQKINNLHVMGHRQLAQALLITQQCHELEVVDSHKNAIIRTCWRYRTFRYDRYVSIDHIWFHNKDKDNNWRESSDNWSNIDAGSSWSRINFVHSAIIYIDMLYILPQSHYEDNHQPFRRKATVLISTSIHFFKYWSIIILSIRLS